MIRPSRTPSVSDILKDLREQVAKRNAVVVVGAGVSLAASGGAAVASWRGLLEHGVARCEEVAAGLPPEWAEIRRRQLATGDVDELISAAEEVVKRLGGPQSGELRRWLRETVGSLPCRDRALLEALRDLELPLATTNYDGLLEEVTGRPEVTWQEPERMVRVLRGEELGILHLHGFWRDADSVVLGGRSYEQVLASVPAQALQQVLGLLHSLVFVGYGGGLEDPNFGSLLRWLRQHWSGLEHRHFRLCRDEERASLLDVHRGDRIFPVPYGAGHADLPAFLRDLAKKLPEPKPDLPGPTPAFVEPVSAPAGLTLRAWPPPELPARPYPLLLPYEHPDLFAGREGELAQVQALLEAPVPILGLFAVSGAGKSSLLAGGLVPALRAEGRAVAFDRRPAEPGLLGRLAGDLFDDASLPSLDLARLEAEPLRFVELLRQARRLSGRPPVLVLDQFEDLFRGGDGERARARVGVLLASTVQRLPGEATPLCRWLLACRRDFHGDLAAWLPDALREARAEGLVAPAQLPHNLYGQERFQAWDLPPLGAPPPGSSPGEARQRAVEAFRAAIVRPLEACREPGQRAYPWTITSEDAERLATAFAEARRAQPEAPLVPQLQVVLAHLLEEAGTPGPGGGPCPLRVAEDPSPLIESALEEHLRVALNRAFPAGRSAAPQEGRSRTLLALRELADHHGRKGGGLPAAALASAVGPGGEAILEALAAAETRILVPLPGPEGLLYTLSHDRLAEVVRRVVDEEGRLGRVEADPAVLELRRFVTHQAQFFAAGEREQGVQIPAARFRAIAARPEALLWDEERRSWWAACAAWREKRRRRRLGWAAAVLVGLMILVPLGQRLFSVTGERSARVALIMAAPPKKAFESAWHLLRDDQLSAGEVAKLLLKRGELESLFEAGPGALEPEAERPSAVLALVEALLPDLPVKEPGSPAVGSMTWALDYFPARERASDEHRQWARVLRDVITQKLRARYGEPPPELFKWVEVPAGDFEMGSPEGEGEDNERPRHAVALSGFRMLAQEVTNRQIRELLPDHQGPDDHPAVEVSWHQAYAFATWLGGRLPTEAEWEYAARAGCRHAYCDRQGNEATLDQVGWYFGNSGNTLHPVGQKEPNPWGLHDLHGNAFEWVADCYGDYTAGRQLDPWGPPHGEFRVLRGGSSRYDASRARSACRDFGFPRFGFEVQGFRVVLPAVPER